MSGPLDMIKAGTQVTWKVPNFPDAHGFTMEDESGGHVMVRTGKDTDDPESRGICIFPVSMLTVVQ